MKHRVLTVFGIRPDFIRASVLLKKMQRHPNIHLDFCFTGQHYDHELMGVFFDEMKIPHPTCIIDTADSSPIQQHAKLISQLEEVIDIVSPDVCIFLGDANAVIGCIAPLKAGIPIAHIEGGMRSYDWRMPEERNRVIADRVSDVIYCYQEDYKYRLIQEGICPTKIVVTGNTIVDVLQEYDYFISRAAPAIMSKLGLKGREYVIMTLHRDENISNPKIATHILREAAEWAKNRGIKIVLPVMPRLKPIFAKLKNGILDSFITTKPLGFFDFVALERNALIEFTDSGTNQETSAIQGVPCVVTRTSTERPDTFKSGITVMEIGDIKGAADWVLKQKPKENFSLGDGRAADIILDDLVDRLDNCFQQFPPVINPLVAQSWGTKSWK